MTRDNETPGERAVKAELKHLKINFIQEKRIDELKGDSKSYRIADFYLPEHDIYIEFLGDWRHHYGKERYKEKMRVYKLNKIKCIWIYPDDLTHTTKVIQKGLLKYKVKFTKKKRVEKAEEPEEKFKKIISIEVEGLSQTVSNIIFIFAIVLAGFLLVNFLGVSEEPIEKSEPISISTSSTEITIENTLQEDISMEVTYRIYSKWYGRDTTETKIFDVGAYQTKTFLVWGNNGCKITGCPNNVEIIESTRVEKQIEEQSRLDKLYSNLEIGMTGTEVRTLLFPGFDWGNPTTTTTTLFVRDEIGDVDFLTLTFDDVVQEEGANGWWHFTDAKLVEVKYQKSGEVYKNKS